MVLWSASYGEVFSDSIHYGLQSLGARNSPCLFGIPSYHANLNGVTVVLSEYSSSSWKLPSTAENVRHYRKKNNHEKRALWYPQMTQDKSCLWTELGRWRREGTAPFARPKTQAESWRNPFWVMKTLSRHLFWWCFFLHPLHFHMLWYYCSLLGSDTESPHLQRALHFPFVLSQPLWIVSFGTWDLA